MSVIGEMKDEKIWALQKRIKDLEAENKKLKEENNTMIAAIYLIRQWTYVALSGVKENKETED